MSGRGRQAAAAFALGYLGGSLPAVYLLGRAGGVDLRRHGSGNVGSHNLSTAAGPAAGLAGWLLDAAKGAGAVLLARRADGDAGTAGAALLGALAGQCWPPLLGWQGGRGVATLVGGILALTPRAAPWPLATIAALAALRPLGRMAGRRPLAVVATGAVPVGVLAGALVWPLACRLQRRAPAEGRAAALAALLLVARRVSAAGLPPQEHRGGTLAARLLLDRGTWRPEQTLRPEL